MWDGSGKFRALIGGGVAANLSEPAQPIYLTRIFSLQFEVTTLNVSPSDRREDENIIYRAIHP